MAKKDDNYEYEITHSIDQSTIQKELSNKFVDITLKEYKKLSQHGKKVVQNKLMEEKKLDQERKEAMKFIDKHIGDGCFKNFLTD